jgi:hypothetical protein
MGISAFVLAFANRRVCPRSNNRHRINFEAASDKEVQSGCLGFITLAAAAGAASPDSVPSGSPLDRGLLQP